MLPHTQVILTWFLSNPRGSVSQFQGFGGLENNALIQYIVIYIYFELEEKNKYIFPTTKSSMNACMELVGSSTFNFMGIYSNLKKKIVDRFQ